MVPEEKSENMNLENKVKPYSNEELLDIWKRKIVNIKMAWSEYQQNTIQPESLPFKAIVELTQNCNFKCVMCPQSWESKFQKYSNDLNMPIETFKKLADQLFPMATFIDLRGFGETTILTYWDEALDYLEKFPFVDWHLVTNLGLPKTEMWEKLMKLGFSLGFSCDGATAETFEKIRARSKFSIILKNLEVIKQARKTYNKGFIYFISTIQKANISEMKAIVEMAHLYDVPEVQFKMVQGDPFQKEMNQLDPEDIRRFSYEAIEAGKKLGVSVIFNDYLFTKNIDPALVSEVAKYVYPKNPNFNVFDGKYWDEQNMPEIDRFIIDTRRVSVHQKCFKPMSFIYVDYQAQVGTCNHMMYPNMLVMGNLKDQDLKSIWNSPQYLKFRTQLLNAKPQDSRCQWCFKHRLDD
jgi:radical SAM protein with 4Fe4S-binding SPASM domain